jgi:hypothetical protein
MSEFTEAGRELVSQLARLRGLHVLVDSRRDTGQGRPPGFAEGLDDRLCDTTGIARSEDVIRLMRQITLLIPQGVSDAPSEQPYGGELLEKRISDLETGTHNIGLLTNQIRRALNNLSVEISDMAVSVFEGKPSPTERSRLLGIADDSRVDIAGGLLAGGIDPALVAELTNLDADVIAAIAADLP